MKSAKQNRGEAQISPRISRSGRRAQASYGGETPFKISVCGKSEQTELVSQKERPAPFNLTAPKAADTPLKKIGRRGAQATDFVRERGGVGGRESPTQRNGTLETEKHKRRAGRKERQRVFACAGGVGGRESSHGRNGTLETEEHKNVPRGTFCSPESAYEMFHVEHFRGGVHTQGYERKACTQQKLNIS